MIGKSPYSIIYSKYVTEKSVDISNKYKFITFKVSVCSNKYDIKYAVEKIFNIKVISVNIINIKGKEVKFKNNIGKRKNWKKSMVFLESGSDINFSEFK